jgi:isochorismate synthase EntC
VRLSGETVTVRPIAGTRKRGATPTEDAALEGELKADPKERAEHVMLVDLGRNDVGRVSRPGTVKVEEREVIERYSHVMHMVSQVSGALDPGLDAWDVIAAAFPPAPSAVPRRSGPWRSSTSWNPSLAGLTPAPPVTSASTATWTSRSSSAASP